MSDDIDNWPDCPVEGCTNKICLALNSDRCFPHTTGNQHVKRWKIEARNAGEPWRRELDQSALPHGAAK